MVRTPNMEVLRTVCEEQARRNAGFLYVRRNLERIKDAYASSSETGGLSSSKGKISGDDVRCELMKWAREGEIEHIRDEEVFFFNPFLSPETDTHELFSVLAGIFEGTPYTTRKEFIEQLRDAEIEIAEDDLDEFIAELKQRDLLEPLRGETLFYKPGSDLEENTDLPTVQSFFEDEAKTGDDGCLTHSQLESALGFTVTPDLKEDLKRRGVLYELNSKYLIDSEDTREDYVSAIVDRGVRREMEEAFKSNDHLLPEQEFDRRLRTQINKDNRVLDKVEDSENLFHDIRRQLLKQLDVNKTTINREGNHLTLLESAEELEQLIDEEAERLVNDAKEEVSPADIGSMEYVITERIQPKLDRYSTNEVASQYIENEILAAARTKLDESDLPVKEQL